jgi:hypothetical protein
MFPRDEVGKVPYFWLWADDSAPARLQRDALAVLADAAERCADEHMRPWPNKSEATTKCHLHPTWNTASSE